MTLHRSRFAAPTPVTAALGTAVGGLLLGFSGCNSTESAEQVTAEIGSYSLGTDGAFFVDTSFGGAASSVRIARQYFGRLVTIEALDANGARLQIHREFVVDPRSENAWNDDDYVLETNPVTGDQTLFIRANYDDTTLDSGEVETGRNRFIRLLRGADAGVRPVVDDGFVGAGQFTMVPRNAAIVFQFDDLIDPNTLNAASVRILTGQPTVDAYEARTFLDPNHGALADYDGEPGLEFYSTRLIVDPAISEMESFASPTPIGVNLRGLPPSLDANLANVQVRFPSLTLNGQVQPILQNPTAHGLTSNNNGSVDFSTSNREIVRAVRSGGNTEVTGDPGNGFLLDLTPPRMVGSQVGVALGTPVFLPVDATNPLPLTFTLPSIQFSSTTCAVGPRKGDIIAQTPFFAEVLEDNSVDASGAVNDLKVRLVVVPNGFLGPDQYIASGQGPVQFRTAYDPALDAGREACFVEVSPTTGDINDPTNGIQPNSTFTIRFNEPIDSVPLEVFEGIALLRKDPSLPDPDPLVLNANTIQPTDHIPGEVQNDASLTRFTFRPTLPLTHVQGTVETYWLRLQGGVRGPRDLAGNQIGALPPAIPFTVEMNADSELTSTRAMLFNRTDEEFPFADTAASGFIAQLDRNEWYGNIDFDTVAGRVRPRSVVRSQSVISQDNDNVLASQMFNGNGTSLPLNPLGARTQFLWRYVDMNLPLQENGTLRGLLPLGSMDLDVEKMYLSPLGANPVFEEFPDFSVALSHSRITPDEVVDQNRNLTDPGSGMSTDYDGNTVSLSEDPPFIVSPRERGYTISPGNLSVAADGTVLVPLPQNEGLPVEQYSTYTYRSTAIDARGGSNGAGAPLARITQLIGQGPIMPLIIAGIPDCQQPGGINPLFPSPQVRTVALPLMVDIKCYPSNGTSTQNQFAHAWAHIVPFSNPQVSTNLPGFRAFTSGGSNQANALILVDPDSETLANGGFDPTSTPPGAGIGGIDNFVYYGAIDFVTRVSRMHSIFYPARDASVGPDVTPEDLNDLTVSSPVYSVPIVIPAQQPVGTEIQFEYRAAIGILTDVNDAETFETTWAGPYSMDPYGDFYRNPINYLSDPLTPPDENISSGIASSCFDGTPTFLVAAENLGIRSAEQNFFLNGSDQWSDDIGSITGADWFQLRVSFINNIATGQFPEIAAIGMSWREE